MASRDREPDASREIRRATMFARIGVMRALNRHAEGVFGPSRKEKHDLRLSATPKYDADILVADPIKDWRRPS